MSKKFSCFVLPIVLATSVIGAEMISIGSFEKGTKGWANWTAKGNPQFVIDHDVAHSGRCSARISATEPSRAPWYTKPEVPLVVGERYRFALWVKSQDFQVKDYGALWRIDGAKLVSDGGTMCPKSDVERLKGTCEWTQLSYEILATAPTLRIDLFLWRSSGTLWFDDVELTVHEPCVRITRVWHSYADRNGVPVTLFAELANDTHMKQKAGILFVVDGVTIGSTMMSLNPGKTGIAKMKWLSKKGRHTLAVELPARKNGPGRRVEINMYLIGHPRLYFSKDDISRLRAKRVSEDYFQHSEIQSIRGKRDNLDLRRLSYQLKTTSRELVVPWGTLTPVRWTYRWGAYGYMASSTDAHSGKRSVKLVHNGYWKDWVDGTGIVAGGLGPDSAYAAKPGTSYRFSFWMKGDLKVMVRILVWDRGGSGQYKAKPGEIVTTLGPEHITPKSGWEHYQGRFTMGQQTDRFAFLVCTGGDRTVQNTGYVLVDDLEVLDGDRNIIVNGGGEDVEDPYDWSDSLRRASAAATLALVYQIEGDRRAGLLAKDYLTGICRQQFGIKKLSPKWADYEPWFWKAHMIGRLAETYDWVYDLLDKEEKQLVRSALLHQGLRNIHENFCTAKNQWFLARPYSNQTAIGLGNGGLVGLVLLGEIEGNSNLEPWLPDIEKHFKRDIETNLGIDGGCGEGVIYQIFGMHHGGCFFVEALDHVKGDSLWKNPRLANLWAFQVYNRIPHRFSGTYKIRVFDDYLTARGAHEVSRAFDSAAFLVSFDDCHPYSGMLDAPAAFWAWLASRYDNPYAQWFFTNNRGRSWVTNPHELLWFDPALQPKAPDDLPLGRYFSGLGMVVSRTSWNPEDLVNLAFLCGSTAPHLWHKHQDQNAFQLYAYGEPLIIDTGYNSPGTHAGGSIGYHAKTSGHNTILIDGDDDSQSWDYGRIRSCFMGGFYDTFTGDAASVYKGRLSRFDRTMVFLKPEIIVKYDCVESDEPHVIEDLLHVNDNGRGQNCITVDGDVISLHGRRAAVQAKVLLPAPFRFRVDGPHHLFLHSAELLEPTDQDQYYLAYGPPGKVKKAEFLLVMFPQRKLEQIPKVSRIDGPWGTGARIESNGSATRVLFSRDGALISTKEVSCDGRQCVVVSAENGWTMLALHQGKHIVFREEPLLSCTRNIEAALKREPHRCHGIFQGRGTYTVTFNLPGVSVKEARFAGHPIAFRYNGRQIRMSLRDSGYLQVFTE